MAAFLKKITSTLLENKNTRQTLLKNVIWLSMGQVVSRLVRAAFIIYAARILGAVEYGVFSYALGLAGFFTVFADIGINGILTREATQRPNERSAIFATTFWIKVVLLAGTAIVVIIVTPLFSKIEAAKILIPLIAFLTILDGLRDFANSFFRALEKMELEAIVTVITNVAISAAGFIILAHFANAFSLTLSYVVSAGTGTLVAIYILRNEFRQIISQFTRRYVRPIIISALPIALYGLFGAFMLNIDIIMLGIWRPAEDIGYYAAGQRILQVLYTIPGIFASAIFSTIARFIGQKK
jgi:O-antigen/teichoic acid export membrane protein